MSADDEVEALERSLAVPCPPELRLVLARRDLRRAMERLRDAFRESVRRAVERQGRHPSSG